MSHLSKKRIFSIKCKLQGALQKNWGLKRRFFLYNMIQDGLPILKWGIKSLRANFEVLSSQNSGKILDQKMSNFSTFFLVFSNFWLMYTVYGFLSDLLTCCTSSDNYKIVFFTPVYLIWSSGEVLKVGHFCPIFRELHFCQYHTNHMFSFYRYDSLINCFFFISWFKMVSHFQNGV